jgi:hypothetical protein
VTNRTASRQNMPVEAFIIRYTVRRLGTSNPKTALES